MWILDYRAEIESDFSVFHRVDNIDELSSSLFFDRAEMLPNYQGAVRGRIEREAHAQSRRSSGIKSLVADVQRVPANKAIDAETLAEISQAGKGHGFPTIGYRKG
jgi:hypothetical protein